MPAQPSTDLVHLRRADNNERFVAFAFAGADMVAEVDSFGTITYAAGAFRSKFGLPPESFIGRSVRSLVAPVDHDALDSALALLIERGRLPPLMIRMSDEGRTRLSVAGLALSAADRPLRLCLSFARPPAPAARVLRAGSAQSLARATEARLRAGSPCDLGLLEIFGPDSVTLLKGDAIGLALESVTPNALASELAPGRFGILGSGGTEGDMLAAAHALEGALRAQGVNVAVTATHLPLGTGGLTPTQAARALRHALNAFARNGAKGLEDAGVGQSLAGYMHRAGRKTDSLRRAIRSGAFTLLYQPIVSLAERSVHHYEALIRPRPIADLPLHTPQEFVMLAEALGLADELDLAVARSACSEAMRAGIPVAFNLSGQSVQSPAFRNRLMALLTGHPACEAGLVIVEMTETAEIEDVEEARMTAEALRTLKVPFCLDDFGAGSSDMRLLRELTADIVKLDGSYVSGVTTAGRERAFIAGMVEIARASGALIVAERIEVEAEAAVLAQLGVHYGQGWLFGRPAPMPVQSARVMARAGETERWG